MKGFHSITNLPLELGTTVLHIRTSSADLCSTATEPADTTGWYQCRPCLFTWVWPPFFRHSECDHIQCLLQLIARSSYCNSYKLDRFQQTLLLNVGNTRVRNLQLYQRSVYIVCTVASKIHCNNESIAVMALCSYYFLFLQQLRHSLTKWLSFCSSFNNQFAVSTEFVVYCVSCLLSLNKLLFFLITICAQKHDKGQHLAEG